MGHKISKIFWTVLKSFELTVLSYNANMVGKKGVGKIYNRIYSYI